jgi:ferredoxin
MDHPKPPASGEYEDPAALCRTEWHVTFTPDDVVVYVRETESIVDALRRQGLRTKYRCRRGGCGACRATIVEGCVRYAVAVSGAVIDGGLGGDADPDPGPKCFPCRAVPETDLCIELGPRDRLVNVFEVMSH